MVSSMHISICMPAETIWANTIRMQMDICMYQYLQITQFHLRTPDPVFHFEANLFRCGSFQRKIYFKENLFRGRIFSKENLCRGELFQ